MSASPPRRRDALETTAAIERAAVDLALEHGYDGVTVDMICERAGVSQRTFFNHFPTKDDALLGSDAPAIDESAAREFLVSPGPLLVDATRLIAYSRDPKQTDAALFAARMRVVAATPALFARQMERMLGVADEVAGIVELRLRARYPKEPERDLRAQAEVITHMLAGVLRRRGEAWARGETVGPEDYDELLARVIPKLG
ncbi:TetR/AcrR family transcriptional regulator [Microbacterium sp. 10M-3C3]|jgi:AcrR family transcriptional regulator|uniref:TetR/AcrR family transcriptional regulator n=1 Tax=Microbacterium sp. 10M-3C3 TaxID=2483401 RepID=UPI000F63379E|nr:TetR/AcrR family transcriptional regulator [Microbacterium sp. 10M-3C3]